MHPLPKKPRDLESEQIVGWFMVAFEDAPDHEYSFAVNANGDILAEGLDLDFRENKIVFPKMLAEQNLRSVRYIQNTLRGDRHVEHNPYS